MHLLVSRLPKRKTDARALAAYADTEGSARRHVKGAEMVGVVEVLADRREGRVGSWGTFTTDADGGLRDI